MESLDFRHESNLYLNQPWSLDDPMSHAHPANPKRQYGASAYPRPSLTWLVSSPTPPVPESLEYFGQV